MGITKIGIEEYGSAGHRALDIRPLEENQRYIDSSSREDVRLARIAVLSHNSTLITTVVSTKQRFPQTFWKRDRFLLTHHAPTLTLSLLDHLTCLKRHCCRLCGIPTHILSLSLSRLAKFNPSKIRYCRCYCCCFMLAEKSTLTISCKAVFT